MRISDSVKMHFRISVRSCDKIQVELGKNCSSRCELFWKKLWIVNKIKRAFGLSVAQLLRYSPTRKFQIKAFPH